MDVLGTKTLHFHADPGLNAWLQISIMMISQNWEKSFQTFKSEQLTNHKDLSN